MRILVYLTSVCALFLLWNHPANAQPFAVGVIGGVRATDDLSGTLHAESQRYIAGPKLEIRLPMHFSIEFDALYRQVGFTGHASSPFFSSVTRERDRSWEFPLIAKYRLSGIAGVHPFVGAGYAPRILHGSDISSGSTLNIPTGGYTYFSNVRSNVSYPVTHGVVISGGVELSAPHLSISPELRYIHWNAPSINDFGGDGSFAFTSKQDEVFVLLGIAWR